MGDSPAGRETWRADRDDLETLEGQAGKIPAPPSGFVQPGTVFMTVSGYFRYGRAGWLPVRGLRLRS